MTRLSATSMELANLGGAKTGIENPVSGIVSDIHHGISSFLRALEPRKTWGFLCELLWRTSRIEMTERVAKHRLAGTRAYTVEELQAMLQSEHGYEVLELLMGHAAPRWWKASAQTMSIARARHHQELARQAVLELESAPLEIPTRRKTKRIVDADRNISAAAARQETALGVLLADGLGAAHGAVAQAKGPARKALGRR